MRLAYQLFMAFLVVLATTTPLLADSGGAGTGMGLAIMGIGVGIGLIGFAALSGIARQPEQAGAIQGAMYVLAGLVEGAGIIALILCLVLGLKG
jgi:F-type H+-transporting ATPase subunit c